MPRVPTGLALLALGLFGPAALAVAQIAVPEIQGVTPMAVASGETSTIEIRGVNLEGASLVLPDPLACEILEARADRVKARVRVPREITPGPRSLRVLTSRGLSGAKPLVVGRPIPVVAEAEPNNGFRKAQAVKAPCAVIGAVSPGSDVDVYAVDMLAGQTLVAEVVAQRAGSGLDALVTIFSPEGRELASDDDLFGHDAAAWAFLPAPGRYLVQVQDANGRNPDGAKEASTTRDYVLNLGEIPLVVSAYPPGGRRGAASRLDLLGVNLPEGAVFRFEPPADAPPGDTPLRVEAPRGLANPINVRVGDAPEFTEPDAEPADDPLRPPVVTIPGAIHGRLAPRDDGDIDYYHLIPAREGDFAITAYAARLGSSADPVLAVVDPRGVIQAEDDDKLGRDARIERRIGPEGLTIAVKDAFGRGGPRFVYRVEVEPMAPRRVVVTADLASLSVPRSGSIAIPISLQRTGDDGAVTVLPGELPGGVSMSPVTIPAKGKGGVLVVSARDTAPLGLFPLRLAVRDTIGGAEVVYGGFGTDPPRMAVAEPAALGVEIEGDELAIDPGAEVEVPVRLDRRTDPARKPVKLTIMAGEGALDAFEKPDEATVPPDKSEHRLKLKAKKDAPAQRVILTVTAQVEGQPPANRVASRAAAITIRDAGK